MKDFPNESYEPENFRRGVSGRVYNLSFNKVQYLKKNDLVDLLTNDIFGLEKNKINEFDKKNLNKLLNNKLLKLYKPENIELFGLKDPREAELTKEEEEKYKLENFPKHIGIGLPHGTHKLPKITKIKIFEEVKEKVMNELNTSEYSKDVKNLINSELKDFYRIMKNFSDFGTTDVVKKSNLVPNNQIFLAKYSRGATDPARSITDTPMNNDFYGNGLKESIKSSHIIGGFEHASLHIKISQFIDEAVKKHGGSIFIDRHDTGVNNMGRNAKLDKYDKGGFPVISLGTLDGESCNPEIVEYYAERIEYHLGVKPLINSPYKGGYVTQKHGRDKRKKLKEEGKNPGINNVIQIEVLKSLYLDEETQIIDKDKAEWIGVGLARAEIDVGLKFDKKYFKNLK